MEPYLKLRDYKDRNDLQQVQLYYFNKGNKLRLDTTVKTKVEYWTKYQKINGRAAEIGQDPDLLNDILREKKMKLEGIILDFKREYNINPDIVYVREEFYKEATKILKDSEVKQQLKEWIEQKAKKVKYVKIFKTVLYDLQDFHPKPLYYRDINYKFFQQLLDYWLTQNVQHKGKKPVPIQNSTINKRLKCFKLFLREKFDTGENEYQHFERFKTGLTPISKPKITIPTPSEFESLCNTPLTDNRLDNARDLYVIGCATGLRYSDVIRLTMFNIVDKGDETYLITDITKTQEQQLLIPLNEVAQHFIKKQFVKGDGAIKYLSNKNLNDALHDLLKFLEFTTPTRVNRRAGNNTTTEIVPKYEALSFHSSRKFFVSTCVNSTFINMGNVMAWSGHTNLAVVKSYIQEGYEQEKEMRKLFAGILKKRPIYNMV